MEVHTTWSHRRISSDTGENIQVFLFCFDHCTFVLRVLIDRGFFRGSYTKFMACVNIPFVLPCLEANCKAAATKSKHSKHWYVVDVLISFFVAAHSIGQAIIFCSCGYYFLSSFFPRLFSAVGNWMSTTHDVALVSANLECRSGTCCTRLAEDTGCKNYTKNHHLRTIAQLCCLQTSFTL